MGVFDRLARWWAYRPRRNPIREMATEPSPKLREMMADYMLARLKGSALSFREDIADFQNGAARPGDDLAMFLARRKRARDGTLRLVIPTTANSVGIAKGDELKNPHTEKETG